MFNYCKMERMTVSAIVYAVVAAMSAEQWVMGDWKPIADWAQCAEMAKPGIIFELRNADGQSMYSSCETIVPALPVGWKSPPKEFRPVRQPPPQHSSPMPPPNPDDRGSTK